MSFPVKQQLYTCTTANLRAGPGYLGDPPPAVLAALPPGVACAVIGTPTTADGLTWFPVNVAPAPGTSLFGWIAERIGDQLLLAPQPPQPVSPVPTPAVPPAPTPAPPSARHGNRLGFYLQSTDNGDGLWDAIARVQPPVLLLHDEAVNDILLNEVRSFRAPNTFIVGRWYVTNDAQRAMLMSPDPEGAGRALADRILNHDSNKFRKRTADGRLFIDAWMSLNECPPGPASEDYIKDPALHHQLYAAYDAFQVGFRSQLQQEGIEAVAFNFAAGNFTEAAHYLDHFPRTLESHVWLGFHEYGWPSLAPGQGASAAGIYRKVLDGVRARFGPRHRVIITEAGVTRSYGTHFDDKGWLNDEQPLDEQQYWESLAWYNDHLNADDYVMGACLYQVGHTAQWETFRHLGHDRQGNPLRLVDRLVALNESAVDRSEAPRGAPRQPDAQVALTGTVTSHGAPVSGALVRVFGNEELLGGVRGAVANRPGAYTWSRKVSGFDGTIRNAWTRYVADKVAGLSYAAFKQQLIAMNPTLAAPHASLHPAETYWFPEVAAHPPVIWDREISGYAGALRSAWLDWVQGKVVGLTYEGFKTLARVYNPSLNADEAHFEAGKVYRLPRTGDAIGYVAEALTDRRGRFTLSGLTPGSYEFEARAGGYKIERSHVTLTADTEVRVTLELLFEEGLDLEARGSGGGAFMGVIGSEFVVNGAPFRFIGVNLRGLVYYGSGLSSMLQTSTAGQRHEAVAQAQAMGARVVRVFLPCYTATTEQTIAFLSQTLDIVGAHGMYLIPAFVNYYKDTDFRIPGDDGFFAKLDHNFDKDLLNGAFFRAGYRERYLPFVRAVVSAFRDDQRIFAWEVGNELKYEPAWEDPGRAALISFMHDVAMSVKQIDANHLVTTGMISTSHASLNEDNLWSTLYGGEAFDFLTVHCYNKEYEGKLDGDFARALNKPFIIEEAGFDEKCPGDRVQLTGQDMDYWFGRGARGYMQWGYMPFGNDIDNGDGDDKSGMDRRFHDNDFDGLWALYRQRADALAAECAALPHPTPVNRPVPAVPVNPPPPVALPNLAIGQTVYAQTVLRVRQSPGFVGKQESDTLVMLNPGQAVTVTGASVARDELTWWPVRAESGQEGWAAQHNGSATLLGTSAPPAGAQMESPRGAALEPQG